MGVLAHLLTNGPHLLTNGPPFWQMDQPFDKWTNLLTNDSRIFFPFLHVNFSRENNLRSRMFVGCGVFFFFFFTVDRGCLLGVGFFEITNVWQVWSIFLRSRMFDRCGVFFFFFEITNVWQVWGCFWDHECLTGVGLFLRSRMFGRCRVVFEITNVWQV